MRVFEVDTSYGQFQFDGVEFTRMRLQELNAVAALEKMSQSEAWAKSFGRAVVAPVKPIGQWNDYEIVCVGHNYSVRLNGQLINTWTDRTQRSLSGYVGLQNYNDGKTVRHRNLRIKELP
jgi:hypothetical protein